MRQRKMKLKELEAMAGKKKKVSDKHKHAVGGWHL